MENCVCKTYTFAFPRIHYISEWTPCWKRNLYPAWIYSAIHIQQICSVRNCINSIALDMICLYVLDRSNQSRLLYPMCLYYVYVVLSVVHAFYIKTVVHTCFLITTWTSLPILCQYGADLIKTWINTLLTVHIILPISITHASSVPSR